MGKIILPNKSFLEFEGEAESVSDLYHTFGELYEHRCLLWIMSLRYFDISHRQLELPRCIWRSQKHSDGSEYEGWFVLGYGIDKGEQITYHLPLKYWDMCNFAQTLDRAFEFDGHTSADVLERLKKLIQ